MSIHRGDFDRKIDIYAVTESSDGYGDQIKTGSLLTSRWAKKEYKGGGTENVEADRLAPIMDVVWTFDFVSGLKEADYITDRDGVEYDIINFQDLERKRYHKVFCKKRS